MWAGVDEDAYDIGLYGGRRRYGSAMMGIFVACCGAVYVCAAYPEPQSWECGNPIQHAVFGAEVMRHASLLPQLEQPEEDAGEEASASPAMLSSSGFQVTEQDLKDLYDAIGVLGHFRFVFLQGLFGSAADLLLPLSGDVDGGRS
jgi:hypothetical protein